MLFYQLLDTSHLPGGWIILPEEKNQNQKSFNVPRWGNLFVTAATEYYKNRNILQEQTIANISNNIKKGKK